MSDLATVAFGLGLVAPGVRLVVLFAAWDQRRSSEGQRRKARDAERAERLKRIVLEHRRDNVRMLKPEHFIRAGQAKGEDKP
jgi:hypothetical protein